MCFLQLEEKTKQCRLQEDKVYEKYDLMSFFSPEKIVIHQKFDISRFEFRDPRKPLTQMGDHKNGWEEK